MRPLTRKTTRMALGAGCLLALIGAQDKIFTGNGIEAMRTPFDLPVVGPPPEPESIHIVTGRRTHRQSRRSHQMAVAVRNQLEEIVSDFSRRSDYYVVEGQMQTDRFSYDDHVIRFGIETTNRRGYAENEWDLAHPENGSMRAFAQDLASQVIGRIDGDVLGRQGLGADVALEVYITGFADASPIRSARSWTGEDHLDDRGDLHLRESEPVRSNAQLGYARAVCFRDYLKKRAPNASYWITGAEHPRRDERGSYRTVCVDLVLKDVRSVEGFEDLVTLDARSDLALR